MTSNFSSNKEIRSLLQKKSNSFCADCLDSCALYVDLSNCIFLCQKCAEIHKKLGFDIKSTIKNEFSNEEIENLKQTDNQAFNDKWMALYNSQSTKVPFGASSLERQSFISEKYVSKKWLSTLQNTQNRGFYNPCHLEIQETVIDDFDEISFRESSSDYSYSTECSTPIDFSFGFSQMKQEIIQPSLNIISFQEDNYDYSNSNDYEGIIDNEQRIKHSYRSIHHVSCRRRSANKYSSGNLNSSCECKKKKCNLSSQFRDTSKMKQRSAVCTCPSASLKSHRKGSSSHIYSNPDLRIHKNSTKLILVISYSVSFDIVRPRRHSKADNSKRHHRKHNKLEKRLPDSSNSHNNLINFNQPNKQSKSNSKKSIGNENNTNDALSQSKRPNKHSNPTNQTGNEIKISTETSCLNNTSHYSILLSPNVTFLW